MARTTPIPPPHPRPLEFADADPFLRSLLSFLLRLWLGFFRPYAVGEVAWS